MSQNNPAFTSKEIVQQFFLNVRSGKHPEKAVDYMADTVLAHQIVSEDPVTVIRTPQNYAEHVRALLEQFGTFDLEIQELFAENNKVFVRWKQTGKHLAAIDGYQPTGLPLTDFGSAVYLIEDGKIKEYWILPDRFGLDVQLKKNALIKNDWPLNHDL